MRASGSGDGGRDGERRAARGASVACLLVSVLGLASPGAAQRLELGFENDLIAIREPGPAPDHDYTSGLRMAWTPETGPTLGLTQRIFTPLRDSQEPVAGERPYAAWLTADASWRIDAEGGRGMRRFGLSVGTLGPRAYGEEVQRWAHEVTGSEVRLGWVHQLDVGPTIEVHYRDGLRAALDSAGAWTIEPYARLFAGNVRAGVEAGAPLLLRMDPTLRLPRARGFGAGAGGSVVWKGRDALLQGEGERGPVERTAMVAALELAAGYRFARWALTYSLTMRSREYESQENRSEYGSLTVVWLGQ